LLKRGRLFLLIRSFLDDIIYVIYRVDQVLEHVFCSSYKSSECCILKQKISIIHIERGLPVKKVVDIESVLMHAVLAEDELVVEEGADREQQEGAAHREKPHRLTPLGWREQAAAQHEVAQAHSHVETGQTQEGTVSVKLVELEDLLEYVELGEEGQLWVVLGSDYPLKLIECRVPEHLKFLGTILQLHHLTRPLLVLLLELVGEVL
jgi:hypothetical protein